MSRRPKYTPPTKKCFRGSCILAAAALPVAWFSPVAGVAVALLAWIVLAVGVKATGF